ncbi:hypothetical protein F2P81_008534 [Scophthalmus maximus]|uniref:Uncharacterized protein n=1 Tax=Scophthalmus maximus TaxID=52904 RepID=A0A6A4T5V2_SCOMX|nr:hypothetical protein F2P81_008534 [Scophthalmus maximus]
MEALASSRRSSFQTSPHCGACGSISRQLQGAFPISVASGLSPAFGRLRAASRIVGGAFLIDSTPPRVKTLDTPPTRWTSASGETHENVNDVDSRVRKCISLNRYAALNPEFRSPLIAVAGAFTRHVYYVREAEAAVVQWSSGPVVLWSGGPVVLWSCGPVVLWSCGSVVRWSCGPVVQWSSGPVVRWSGGPVVLWFSGPVVLLSSQTSMQSLSMSSLFSSSFYRTLHPFLILFSSSFHPLHILFSSSSHPLLILFSSSSHPFLILFSSSS